MNSPPAATIPVAILTGFLGSGKTTLLNRILSERHGQKIAVIENEFGEIGIDHELVIQADEEIFEMNNGCICCKVRGDLIRILANLSRRRAKFDQVLIETTGLAHPAPILQTFLTDPDIRAVYSLQTVITVVDAKHCLQQLGHTPEASEQIAFADVLLINKMDLVPREAATALEARLRKINPMAQILHASRADVPLAKLFSPAPVFQIVGTPQESSPLAPLHSLDHHHDEAVTSVGLTHPGEMHGGKLVEWLTRLVQERGPDIYRMKGVFAIAGKPEKVSLQAVHMIMDTHKLSPWGQEPRKSSLVFIGRRLDRAVLQKDFNRCRV